MQDSKSDDAKKPVDARKAKAKKPKVSNDAIVIQKLKAIYKDKLLPVEKTYLFHKFNQPEILDAELGAKATALLIGQYSTGKTSFIRHLIGMDYPEMHIGPEPTTDRFIAVVHGEETKVIKGNALTGVTDLPFSGLSVFGTSFLNKFSAAVVNAPLLQDLTIIDTPGVLSGEKQRTARGYDFAKVSRWFAERSDLILLLFDCSKLDISDEFKGVIEELQPFEDKIHCILNKADMLDTESLMRVYGALLWSMGRIFRGAEVTRIYVGSFHDSPLLREEHRTLFEKDKEVLMNHLMQLPKACAMRKINDMVKRIRQNVVHACIIGYLRAQMPILWGRERKQAQLLQDLAQIFRDVRSQYQLAEGDMPKVEDYRSVLALSDISQFPQIDRKVLQSLQDLLLTDIPEIAQIVAGVSSSSFSQTSAKLGNNSTNSNEDGEADGISAQQLQMFKFDESKKYSGPQKLLVDNWIYWLVALIVLVLAVASSFEDHRTAKDFLNFLVQEYERLSRSNTSPKN
jgi:EH domain-containing protein 1